MTGSHPKFDGQAAAERFARALTLYQRALAAHREAIDTFGRVVDRWGGRSADRPPGAQPPVDQGERDLEWNAPDGHVDVKPAQRLTRRQREVVALIAQGYSNEDIARRLVVTRGTAANHVAAVLDRLGMSNRAQVAAWAVSAGLAPAAPRDAA